MAPFRLRVAHQSRLLHQVHALVTLLALTCVTSLMLDVHVPVRDAHAQESASSLPADNRLTLGVRAPTPSLLEEDAVFPSTRLPDTDLAGLARVDTLLQSGKIDEALDGLTEIFSLGGSESLDEANSQLRAQPVRVETQQLGLSNRWGELYLPIQEVAQRRFFRMSLDQPQWLEAYRRRVDRQAGLLLAAARQTGDLDAEIQIVSQFLLATDAPEWIESLADRLLERGRALEALRWYDRLLVSNPDRLAADLADTEEQTPSPSDEDLAPRSLAPEIVYPSEASQELRVRVAYKRVVAAWLCGHRSVARQWWLEIETSRQRNLSLENRVSGVVQGESIDLRRWSAKLLQFDPDQSLETLKEQAINEHVGWEGVPTIEDSSSLLDLDWKVVWSVELELPANRSSDRRESNEGVGAGGYRWVPQIQTTHHDSLVLAFNGQRLRAWNRMTGEPWISLGPDTDDDPLRRGTLWELADYQTPPIDPRPIEGAARYSVQIGEGVWGVRGGDPRAIVQDIASRVPSWWTGFDIHRQAALLPATPWSLEPGLEWEGNAVYQNGCWWSVQREAAVRDQRSRSWLVAFESLAYSPDAHPTGLPIRHRILLSEASNLGKGEVHECSHVEPAFDDASVYVAGPTGSISSVDLRSGRPAWWFTYPQTLSTSQSRWDANTHRWREGGDVWSDGTTVIAVPPDSDRVFALEASSGRLLWSVAAPEASRVVGRTPDWIILSGPQLIWIELSTGSIAARFPALPTARAMPTETFAEPLFGHVALHEGKIYCGTRQSMWVLDAELRPQRFRDGSVGWACQPIKKIEWSHWGIEAGDLVVEKDSIWISNDSRIVHLRRP